jgi:hypothetical protein
MEVVRPPRMSATVRPRSGGDGVPSLMRTIALTLVAAHVIIDTSGVVEKPADGRRGAGVLGAYWLRVEAAP